MSKTPEQMRKKMAGKATKLAGKVGDEESQKKVAEKFSDKKEEEQK